MTIQVEIMPCGTKAKELNPHGDKKPVRADYAWSEKEYSTYVKHKNDWKKAESERKEYEIDGPLSYVTCYCFTVPFPCDKHKPGTIHHGIIVNNKIKIV